MNSAAQKPNQITYSNTLSHLRYKHQLIDEIKIENRNGLKLGIKKTFLPLYYDDCVRYAKYFRKA